MKQTASTLVLFFILLFAYTKLAGPIPFSLNNVVTTKSDTFAVSGEGKVTMVPDIAVVDVGVTSSGATVAKVQQELNTKINAVSAAIKKLGVDQKDIKTSYYNIQPTYDYTGSSQRVTGYQANSNLTIKVKKIDNVNSVIDAATAQGANQVGSVSFDVDDKTKAENQAREQAVAEAKSKAKAAARAAGFTLGRVINYSEGGGTPPGPIMYEKMAVADAAEGVPTQVEPGTAELTVSVTLSYEIL